MKYHYSSAYQPPAPVVEIAIASPAEGLRVGLLPAFVDSGADGTIVPSRYLDEINAPVTVEMSIRSQWGERRRVLLYLVDVQIGDITLPGAQVVGDQMADEVILGRDVLNKLRVLLDGPARTIEIRE